jgi:predicted DNA-binding protein (MmcQ/YjbR family)
MNTETLRSYCLSLPRATEDIKWGHDLCFLIAGKMFAVASLEKSDAHCVSFKCTPERFAELTEMDGIIPAPYMARNHWVTLERFSALRDAEIKEFVRDSYQMVLEKLPKKTRDSLAAAKGESKRHPARKQSKAK